VGFLIFGAIVLAIALRVTTPAERARAIAFAKTLTQEVREAVALNREKCEPFQQSLRARSRWIVVVPAIAAINVSLFAGIVVGDGSISDLQTLTSWGGSYGPLTTNSGWWRVVTSAFVHLGILHLAVTTAALLQVGTLLERMVGRTVVGVAYAASGIFSGLTAVWAAPMTINAGSSGAIFGLYGLLIATAVRGFKDPSIGLIPRVMWKRLVPVTAAFTVYSLSTPALTTMPEMVGMTTGLVCGFVLLWEVSEDVPPVRRVAITSGAALFIAAAAAVPLRGITDVRPEIERLAAMESKTSKVYVAAAERFKKRKITAEALADTIGIEILPEISTAEERLRALTGVPAEHRPLVQGAEEYLRLRGESWRLRAEALRASNAARLRSATKPRTATENARRGVEASHQSNLFTFANADTSERASLQALDKVRSSATN
jgi:rhomboid protease GluP